MKLTLFLLAFVVGAAVASARNYQTEQNKSSSDGQSSSSRLASATSARYKRSSTEGERKDEEHSVPTGGEHAAKNHSHLEEEKAAIEGEKPSNTKRTKRSGRKAAGNGQKPSSAKERTRTKRSTAEGAGKGGEHSAATGEQSSSGQHRKELIVTKLEHGNHPARNQPIEGPTGEASKSKSSGQQTAKRKKRIATENKGKGGSSGQNNSGSQMSGFLGEKSPYAGVLDADHSVELYTVIQNAKETNKTVGDAIDQYLSKQGFSAQKIKELNAQQAELEKKRATSA